MFYFLRSMGPYSILEVILLAVIAVLAIKKTIDLFGRKNLDATGLKSGLHAILFWGVIALAVGVLGQMTGIYLALNVIATAKAIDPKLVAMGFAQSFTTTIFGLAVFLFAAVIWFALLMRYKRLTTAKS